MNKTILIFLLIVGGLSYTGYKVIIAIDEKLSPLPIYGTEDHKIEPFRLENQRSQIFDSQEHLNSVWVVNYFFTSCPSVCPKMMKNVQEVHDIVRSESDVLLLSMTVDPIRDTSEKLMTYLDNYNVNHDSWQLLTGEKKDLYRLARKSFLISATDGGGDEYDFIHSENIIVIDKNRKIRAIINGTDPEADRLILQTISRIKNAS